MAEMLVSVFGITAADRPTLSRELSDIFGAPADADATLSGFGEAVGFVVKLAKTNVAEVAKQIVAMVRNAVGMRIELDVNGVKLMVDGATSIEQLMPLLQLALSQRQ